MAYRGRMRNDQVREAYAARAGEYIAALGSVASMHPADARKIAAWGADLSGPVVDAGCGPGHWTAYLRDRGVDVTGVDLVPEFLTSAAARFPHVPFRCASLGDLGVPDAALGGILAWYSLIHLPPERLPAALAEFARCLRPGGRLLLGFFAGRAGEAFDHAVAPAYFWSLPSMRRALLDAGFAVEQMLTRTDPGHRPHASITARRS